MNDTNAPINKGEGDLQAYRWFYAQLFNKLDEAESENFKAYYGVEASQIAKEHVKKALTQVQERLKSLETLYG